jgi:uncharacterized PurR-regulated membrane protein YhhQ (DUF165 family)
VSEQVQAIIQRTQTVYRGIADDLCPHGDCGRMVCRESCGFEFSITATEVAQYLRHGWGGGAADENGAGVMDGLAEVNRLIDDLKEVVLAVGREARTVNRSVGFVALAGYIATVFLANWAIQHYGVVNVGFGQVAPAGVYFVGLAFTLRDITQDTLGRRAVIAAILVGAVASYWVAPSFALASGVAFLVSEAVDFAVYTPLRARHWLGAVALSNTVGLLFDSVLFLWLAFHSLAFLPGQLIAKLYMTIAAVGVLWVWRQQARPAWETA